MSTMSDQQGATGSVEPLLCRYPDCTDPEDPAGRPRPAAERSGNRGRQPLYCGQRDEDGPIHSRQNALAEIHRREARQAETIRRAGIEARNPADAERIAPVDLARASAGVLLEQMRRIASDQAQTAQQIVAQLATASDPAALETQLQAATTAARADVATARAGQAAAEQQAQAADARARAAVGVADAANAAAEDAEQALRAEQDAHRITRGELEEQTEAAREQIHRAELAEDAAAQLKQALHAERTAHSLARTALEGATTELGTVRASAESAAAVFEERERSLTAHASQLTTQLEQTRAQVEQLHADVRGADATASQQAGRAERAENENTRLVEALTAAQTEQNSALSELGAMHEQLSQLRIDSATAAAIADTQLGGMRSEVERLREQLAQATESVQTATARALTAESQLGALRRTDRT